MPQLVNLRTGSVVVLRLTVARSAWDRTRGLLGRPSLPEDEGLLIEKCRIVHMLFMRFPIDIVFCSRESEVLAIQADLLPWRISRFVRKADFVIELPAGRSRSIDLLPGDRIEIR